MGDEGPIYFFKEDDPKWGWLCQWFASPFNAEDERVVYQHAEQYMMQQKALRFSDRSTAREILLTSSPRTCKVLGKATAGFKAEIWDECKLAVVTEGSYYKFTHSLAADPEELRNKLLATRNRELVEASRFDRTWGVGFSCEQLKLGKKGGYGRERWGDNLLGKALMAARERIRAEGEEGELLGIVDNSRLVQGCYPPSSYSYNTS